MLILNKKRKRKKRKKKAKIKSIKAAIRNVHVAFTFPSGENNFIFRTK